MSGPLGVRDAVTAVDRSRRVTVLAWAVSVVVAVGVGLLAGRAVFAPPSVEQEAGAVQTYTVVEATVGQSSTFSARAVWPTVDLADGAVSGTVTTVDIAAGQQVEQGQTLYTVGLRPVVAARGAVPAFRDLSEGKTGRDVAQLQQLLIDAGHLSGKADDKFTSRTARAVRVWQRTLGVEQTGVVLAGDIVYVPELPARLLLADEVRVGAVVGPGSVTVRSVDGAPEISLSIAGSSDVPPVGTAVTATFGDLTWEGVVGELRSPAEGAAETTAVLLASDGGPLCGQTCDQVPLEVAPGAIVARVERVASATGPVVPVAALGTAADGSVFVLDQAGARRPVQIVATDGSRAVVDGLTAGEIVRLFATPDASAEQGARAAPVAPSASP